MPGRDGVMSDTAMAMAAHRQCYCCTILKEMLLCRHSGSAKKHAPRKSLKEIVRGIALQEENCKRRGHVLHFFLQKVAE